MLSKQWTCRHSVGLYIFFFFFSFFSGAFEFRWGVSEGLIFSLFFFGSLFVLWWKVNAASSLGCLLFFFLWLLLSEGGRQNGWDVTFSLRGLSSASPKPCISSLSCISLCHEVLSLCLVNILKCSAVAMRATWLTLKEVSVSSQMKWITVFKRTNAHVEWLSLPVFILFRLAPVTAVCNCWWAVSFTSVIVLTLRSVGSFLKGQILNQLCMEQIRSQSAENGEVWLGSMWREGKQSVLRAVWPVYLSWHQTGTLHVGQVDLVGGIGKQQLLPCGVALCCLWGKPCIWTKWPQPKVLSREQEKGCHGKGCFSGGRLQRHQHLQHSTSCASPAAHCSEQWLDWSNSCFPEHSQCPVCCSCWHWGRASGWHRVFPDSSAHFSAELEMLLVLYLKYVQLTWSDLIILWWCLAIPDSPTVLSADNQTTAQRSLRLKA